MSRSTDHFPANVGSYSIRIENNTALLPDYGYGITLQNLSGSMNDGPSPTFPVIGHPTNLTGYYKFAPENGDTLKIQVLLYLNGTIVTAGVFISSTPEANWMPFNVPFPPYSSADSASILLSSYLADGPPPSFVPRGNSVLYVDNLNFDSLITANVADLDKANETTIYPNPANEELTLVFGEKGLDSDEIMLFDVLGKEVFTKAITTAEGSATIDVSDLEEGIYYIQLKGGNQIQFNERITIRR